MKNPVIVYHDCCHDGVTALWVALKRYPDGEPYPGRYEQEPDLERMRGRDVLVVDFSWKRPEIIAIKSVARQLMVLDHHKSAEAELAGIDGCTFDMNRSGAGLTWDTLFPGKERPQLVDYVEDRDLWRFALPFSREVHLACNCEPLTIEARQQLMDTNVDVLVERGKVLQKYHEKLVETTTRHSPMMRIAGHDVPCVGCATMEIVSDVCHVLAVGHPFAASYYRNSDGLYLFSLRSANDGADVSEVAKRFGGGGHKHAAGFSVSSLEQLEAA